MSALTQKRGLRRAGLAPIVPLVLGVTAAAAIAAPAPPNANFTINPSRPMINQAVTFDASSSTANGGKISSYTWNFGDGATGTGVNVTHAFAKAGTYQVALTVTDNNGSTGQFTQAMSVIAPATVPTANLGSGGTVPVHFGIANILVLCPSTAPSMCQGAVTLSTASKVAIPGRHKTKRKLTLGTGVYTVDPGSSESVGIKISSTGLKVLKRLHHLTAVVRLVDTGTTIDTANKTTTTTGTVSLALH